MQASWYPASPQMLGYSVAGNAAQSRTNLQECLMVKYHPCPKLQETRVILRAC